jgi:hypothetical protein
MTQPLTVRLATGLLFNRYLGMLAPNSHEYWLCQTALDKLDEYPIDKLSRWLGYVQGVLCEKGVTTTDKERDFSRPLFHEAYRNEGIDIPPTLDKVKPVQARLQELRETIGLLPARRQATREALLGAIESAETVQDLKRILLTMIQKDNV